jgi:hypothetical protein
MAQKDPAGAGPLFHMIFLLQSFELFQEIIIALSFL